jgi:phosphoribosylglycinamide formyltransferase 1
MKRTAVLASGSGTNLQALIDAVAAGHPAQLVVVASDKRDAFALERAREANIPAVHVGKRKDESREAYDQRLVDLLRAHHVDWVCLAGFMRLVTPTLLDAFPHRVLNIHPALLPAFPGLHAQAQAHAYGVRVTGVTVHFVDAGTDTGPIIAQTAVPVLPDDTVESLSARILLEEHRLYPTVLRWAVEGRLHLDGRHVHIDVRAEPPA